MAIPKEDFEILLDDFINSLKEKGINLDLIEFVDVTDECEE